MTEVTEPMLLDKCRVSSLDQVGGQRCGTERAGMKVSVNTASAINQYMMRLVNPVLNGSCPSIE
jgi:hypothetical protein